MSSWPLPSQVQAGDVIDPNWGNDVVECLSGMFGYIDATQLTQPFQVGKPSILLLLVEGLSTVNFPNSVSVYLSPDSVIYTEVAACDFPLDGKMHVHTLTVPIPLGYYCYWNAPYGFVRSAILF